MTEQQLISQAQQGATDCFSQLVASYQSRLYSYLLGRCHNAFDADDVLQETFINAYRYLDSYDARWQFSTWLFTIARRLLGQLKTVYHVTLDALSGREPAIENDLLALDRNNFWRLIKRDVSARQYDLLWFFYVEQYTIKDIAHIMKQSESWVKTNLHRGKMTLSNNRELAALLEHN
ncbi:RNA polymerase sigma factor [Marinicella sediminis]|uniref:RNA polymerase sigma factor n=1 Tax=Marinicella sediminis TaxID=1792834 RepID=A0ABV7JCL7_9GAMM|nr:sigma-70 family RNA polymerase sigma factor [Marinicella sediminis]